LGSVEQLGMAPRPVPVRLREMMPNREEWRRSVAPCVRGTVIGFVIGLLPGPHTTLSSFLSYRVEKAVSRYRHEIGDGAVEGIAGPETANNAAATSTMVPLLALGLPFGAVTGLMLAAMVVQGVQPGPLLMKTHPEIFWGVIVSMYVGNVMLLVLNIPMVGLWVSLLRLPQHVLLPLILALAVIGAYSVNNSMLDVLLLVLLGLVGYVLRRFDFQLAPLVIGLVLGPMIEKHLREGLFMNFGEVSTFYESPVAILIWIVALLVLTIDLQRKLLAHVFGVRLGTLPSSEND
jgi:putative tricarboxylic transport membrane protein